MRNRSIETFRMTQRTEVTMESFDDMLIDPLSTTISAKDNNMNNWMNRVGRNASGASLQKSFNRIQSTGEKLFLQTPLIDMAKQYLKNYKDTLTSSCHRMEKIEGACLYHACKNAGCPRTLKEIIVAMGYTPESCKLGKCVREVGETLTEKMSVTGDKYVNRFVSLLDLDFKAGKAAKVCVKMCEERDIRHTPKTLAAVAIYIMSLLCNGPSISEISNVTSVAESTIKSTFTSLRPILKSIVPDSFAEPQALKRIMV